MQKDIMPKVFLTLMAVKKYYAFNLGNFLLIGMTKQEIINTMDYYTNERKLEGSRVPKESEIWVPEGDIYVNCAFPLVHKDHHFNAEVRKGFFFNVYENALDYVKDLAKNYEELKRGDLFKVVTLEAFGFYFLPEYVMEGVRKYDWSQYDQQVNEWLGIRENILQSAENAGVLRRSSTVKSKIDDFFGQGMGNDN